MGIRIPANLCEELERLAAERKETRAALIVEAIRGFLARQSAPGVPLDAVHLTALSTLYPVKPGAPGRLVYLTHAQL